MFCSDHMCHLPPSTPLGSWQKISWVPCFRRHISGTPQGRVYVVREKVLVQTSRKCSLYLDLEFSRFYSQSLYELLSESLPPRTDQADSLEYVEPECIWEVVICRKWAGIGHAGPHSVRWSCVCETKVNRAWHDGWKLALLRLPFLL